MTELSDKILTTIQEQGLKPAPKASFRLKNFLLWALFGLSILVGALSVGVSIFLLANQEWDLYQYVTGNPLAFLLLVLPYFWLVVIIIFIAFGFYNYQHTKFGYRLPLLRLAIIYLLATLILGLGAYRFGLGHRLNNFFNEQLPGYQHLNYEHYLWQKADQGLLAGEIISLTPTGFILEDLKGDHWQVNALTAILVNGATLAPQEQIKIIGERSDVNKFLAREIRPWCGCGGCLKTEHCVGKCGR
ncbi:MAG TPA: hypothetical protein P5267_00300 [Patescibacteria group bacterium]|nr:hypothetical protein [Patescibacteria group bacterium]